MKEILKVLNEEEKKILIEMKIKSNDLSDIEEEISDYMIDNFVIDDELTEKGIICENILNKIGNLE